MRERITIKAIFKESFGLYRSQARALLPVALLLAIAPALFTGLTYAHRAYFSPASILITVSAAVIGTLATTIYKGAVAGLVRDLREGRAAGGWLELLGSVRPLLAPLAGVGLLAGLAVGIGNALFVIPGLILQVIWVVVAPAIVIEGAGMRASFARSRELVRGNFWPVVGVLVITGVIAGAPLIALTLAAGQDHLLRTLAAVVILTLTTPLYALVTTVLYFHLRAAEQASAAVVEGAVPGVDGSHAGAGQGQGTGGKVPIGATLKETFGLYRMHAGVLLPSAFWLFLVVAIIDGVSDYRGDLATVGVVAGLLIGTLYKGMVIGLVRDLYGGRDGGGIMDLARSAAPALMPLVGAGLLTGIGITIGLILILVPGLILLTIWAVVAPVIVVEDSGVRPALKRSRELVRGNGWRVFAIVVLTSMIAVVVAIALGAAAAAIDNGPLLRIVFAAMAWALASPIAALAVAVLYFRLLAIKGAPVAAAPPPPLEPAGPATDA